MDQCFFIHACNFSFDIKIIIMYTGIMRLNTEKIKKEMARLNWTQTRLAKEMGVKRQYVQYMLKSGTNPTIKTINRFAAALDVSPMDLVQD
jgi:predicted transcriptional regulator